MAFGCIRMPDLELELELDFWAESCAVDMDTATNILLSSLLY